ncbi:hypothetical protein IWZ00DRAFT_495950 [Phyllosticta capitalensis]
MTRSPAACAPQAPSDECRCAGRLALLFVAVFFSTPSLVVLPIPPCSSPVHLSANWYRSDAIKTWEMDQTAKGPTTGSADDFDVQFKTSRSGHGGDIKSPTSGHGRTLSGNLLSKLPFLRSSCEELPLPLPLPAEARKEEAPPTGTTPKRITPSTHLQAVRQTVGRRRKGSLRKTALLGTGRQRSNDSQRMASSLKDNLASSQPAAPDSQQQQQQQQQPQQSTTHYPPRPFTYSNPSATSSSESGWSAPSKAMSPDQEPSRPVLASPISSPVSNPYASTTDDDNDSLPYTSRPPIPNHLSSSYFPPGSVQRRRSTKTITPATRHSSPLALPPATLDIDEWDYSETEWWGWVVVIVTWVVFVVGMGSCMEVWSWAWDVGETPYAPPELEDDPTLPIVGYYPALMVLTAVMAWVWVVIAWVGMKYFRHAKVVGEES